MKTYRCLSTVGLARSSKKSDRLYVVAVIADVSLRTAPGEAPREWFRFLVVSFSGVKGNPMRESIRYEGVDVQRARSIARKLTTDKIYKDGYQTVDSAELLEPLMSAWKDRNAR